MKKYYAYFAMFLAVAGAFAATQTDVAIVYDGNTPVNSDAVHFITQQSSSLHKAYKFSFFKNPSAVDEKKYQAVVVLNTGAPDGIDPKLQKFMESWGSKTPMILVTLKKNSQDMTVTRSKLAVAGQDIDAITSASKWEGRGALSAFGGKAPPSYELHVSWVNQVFAFIDDPSKKE